MGSTVVREPINQISHQVINVDKFTHSVTPDSLISIDGSDRYGFIQPIFVTVNISVLNIMILMINIASIGQIPIWTLHGQLVLKVNRICNRPCGTGPERCQ